MPIMERNGIQIGGYLKEAEDENFLINNAQPPEQYVYGDVNPKELGDPIGMDKIVRIENQQHLNSCAGNSATSVLEACIYFASGGKITDVQLSRMWAYVQGQRQCGINGDRGATLAGVIQALQQGCPVESLAPYTGQYYTNFSQEAKDDAPKRQLLSFTPVNDVMQVYEGLAKRIGGLYLGIACTDEIFNCTGDITRWSEYSTGCHAMCVLDWSKKRAKGGRYDGFPCFDLSNSWGTQWGDNGHANVHPEAMQNMLKGRLTSAYFLSDAKIIKPRFDWKMANDSSSSGYWPV